jgi:hypothetical protein
MTDEPTPDWTDEQWNAHLAAERARIDARLRERASMPAPPDADLAARREKAAIDAHALYVAVQHVPADSPARMILRAMHVGAVAALCETYPPAIVEEIRRMAAAWREIEGKEPTDDQTSDALECMVTLFNAAGEEQHI